MPLVRAFLAPLRALAPVVVDLVLVLAEDLERNRLVEPVRWLKDRYGVSWQVIPDELVEMLDDKDPEKAKRTTEAMLVMNKLDIAALQRGPAPSARRR
jgi:hypothetical protein